MNIRHSDATKMLNGVLMVSLVRGSVQYQIIGSFTMEPKQISFDFTIKLLFHHLRGSATENRLRSQSNLAKFSFRRLRRTFPRGPNIGHQTSVCASDKQFSEADDIGRRNSEIQPY